MMQSTFDFMEERLPPLLPRIARPIVVVQVDGETLVRTMPQYRINPARLNSWQDVFVTVCHQANDHISLRVRA